MLLDIDNKRLISAKLHELLVQEIDFDDSELNKFIDNTALNIILSTLSKEKRMNFYTLLSSDSAKEAQDLIKAEIPDFYQLVLNSVQEKFKEIL